MGFKDKVWHGWLRRPYRLHKAFDAGSGQPVVLLHGLGRSAAVWQYVEKGLEGKPYRLVAFDLLGFGNSPKPPVRYTVDDHAQAVIAAIDKAKLKRPAVIVGHSMGSLIAVRVARSRPDLVRHLVLYEMPLYKGLPERRAFRIRLKLYFGLYERIITYRPIFSGPGKGRAQRLAERIAGFTLSDETWRPFVKSLKHTIMEQDTAADLKQVTVPVDVIYGTRDQLVIHGETKLIFGEDAKNVTAHTVKESHRISPLASQFLVERIRAATASGHTEREIKAGKPLPRRKRKRAATADPKIKATT